MYKMWVLRTVRGTRYSFTLYNNKNKSKVYLMFPSGLHLREFIRKYPPPGNVELSIEEYEKNIGFESEARVVMFGVRRIYYMTWKQYIEMMEKPLALQNPIKGPEQT